MQQILGIGIIVNTPIERMKKPERLIYFPEVAQLGPGQGQDSNPGPEVYISVPLHHPSGWLMSALGSGFAVRAQAALWCSSRRPLLRASTRVGHGAGNSGTTPGEGIIELILRRRKLRPRAVVGLAKAARWHRGLG